jgi:uncharacterized protein DUF1778
VSRASEQARRISVRLSAQLKATIERAAESRGQSLNQFLIATLAEGANNVLKHTDIEEAICAPADVGARLNGRFAQCAPPVAESTSEPAFQPPVVISLVPYSGSRACPGLTFGL